MQCSPGSFLQSVSESMVSTVLSRCALKVREWCAGRGLRAYREPGSRGLVEVPAMRHRRLLACESVHCCACSTHDASWSVWHSEMVWRRVTYRLWQRRYGVCWPVVRFEGFGSVMMPCVVARSGVSGGDGQARDWFRVAPLAMWLTPEGSGSRGFLSSFPTLAVRGWGGDVV